MEFDENVNDQVDFGRCHGMYSITKKLDNNDKDIFSKIVNNNIKISILILSKNLNDIY